MIQAIGGGFPLANSAAILTDAFPPLERGMALGLNQIAFISGSLIGLILGGFLAVLNWRLVFLVSVPIGIAGTIWAYLKLKETGAIARNEKVDLSRRSDLRRRPHRTSGRPELRHHAIRRSFMGWESPWS